MPQKLLPMIPRGTTYINNLLSVGFENDSFTYFHGMLPILTHKASDTRMFHIITSQLIDSGACRQVDIIKTFGVSKESVARASKKYRTEGASGFYKPRKRRRGGTIFTAELLEKAQDKLDLGMSRKDLSKELGVNPETLRKAISDGRLKENRFKSKKKI